MFTLGRTVFIGRKSLQIQMLGYKLNLETNSNEVYRMIVAKRDTRYPYIGNEFYGYRTFIRKMKLRRRAGVPRNNLRGLKTHYITSFLARTR